MQTPSTISKAVIKLKHVAKKENVGDKQFSCLFCTVKLASKRELNQHEKLVHFIDQSPPAMAKHRLPLNQPAQNKMPNLAPMPQAIATCQQENEQFQCTMCGECARDENSLKVHIVTHHANEVTVTICKEGNAIDNVDSRRQNVKSQEYNTIPTNVAPSAHYPRCMFCGVQFFTDTHVRKHYVHEHKIPQNNWVCHSRFVKTILFCVSGCQHAH
jgi:hypothetical protein